MNKPDNVISAIVDISNNVNFDNNDNKTTSDNDDDSTISATKHVSFQFLYQTPESMQININYTNRVERDPGESGFAVYDRVLVVSGHYKNRTGMLANTGYTNTTNTEYDLALHFDDDPPDADFVVIPSSMLRIIPWPSDEDDAKILYSGRTYMHFHYIKGYPLVYLNYEDMDAEHEESPYTIFSINDDSSTTDDDEDSTETNTVTTVFASFQFVHFTPPERTICVDYSSITERRLFMLGFYFGDRVFITSGMYAGITGMITAGTNQTYVIDDDNHIRVHPDNQLPSAPDIFIPFEFLNIIPIPENEDDMKILFHGRCYLELQYDQLVPIVLLKEYK